MKKFVRIFLPIILPLLGVVAVSCVKDVYETGYYTIPEGEPVTLTLSFGAEDFQDVVIGTKSEMNRADESRIHDLYVLIFDKSNGKKIYGRYYTYEHLSGTLESLLAQKNEGWFVENLLLSDVNTDKKTRGVVKLSTVSKENCQLIVLANISNTITSISGTEALEWLSSDDITLSAINEAQITLEQNVVNRGNLFLMMGMIDIANTGNMAWDKTGGTSTGDYGADYKIQLTTLDAKVKFRVKYDETNISSITPRFWQAVNVPDRCMLVPSEKIPSQIGTQFFNTDEAYFEGTETEAGVTWQVFSFYLLETKPRFRKSASEYYQRDKHDKNGDGTNQETWEFAPLDGTYVRFDVILNLTRDGIRNILDDPETNHALTSDALFTVHLGDFTSSRSGSGHDYNNYSVERGHAYTYNITIINSKSIFVEVMNETENESGHEGSLLLTTDEIINCDSHYEYHNMVFKANAQLATDDAQKKLSWFTKSPFAEEGPVFNETTKLYEIPKDAVTGALKSDCLWVKFGLNKKEGGLYTDNRFMYPGDSEYDPDWNPAAMDGDPDSNPVPSLIDVNQLINLLFVQNKRKANNQSNLFDSANELRFTAFVNEFYYEVNPLTGELDPDLWRQFVNARPRELHILSETKYSKDQKSDVVKSSHSIIQNSIQSFYNIYSPDLSSAWGVEHKDEMRNRGAYDSATEVNRAWSWWHDNWNPTGIINDEENGRINTFNIWGVSDAPAWSTFMDYEVANDTPELKPNYQYMAYSCMTRNRDNNGNGVIDPEELRWYTASINQLIGMWVGNEALSLDARLYQPLNAASSDPLKWRAHVLSSTCNGNGGGISNPRVIRAEEGATKSYYNDWTWAFDANSPQEYRDRVASIRCVRNVGTFRKDGEATDISYAPYDRMVDQYYEIPKGTDNSGRAFPNEDGTYTITFSRLNPKCVREYSAEDLPYHEEFSLHNRVYLELNLQNPEVHVKDDGENISNEQAINKKITSDGFNSYCPPGYRLPNMTEMLVISDLVPKSFWNQSGQSGNQFFPCRTYFSRGVIGSNKTTSEAGKIGWQYIESNGRVNMANDNSDMTGVRCVRDNNMTGDITGKVMIANYNQLHNNEQTTISINVSSTASAIRNVDMALVYVDIEGNEHFIRIDEVDGISISGVTLKDDFTYTIPDNSKLPVRGWMTLRAVVRNAMGIERTFETPVRIISEVTTSIKLLPCDYDGRTLTDERYTFPVLLTAFNEDNDITSWRLKIVSPDKATRTVSLGSPNERYTTTVYPYNPYEGGASLLEGTYTFQLEAECDGTVVRSEIVSMDVLRVDYRPIPEEEVDSFNNSRQLNDTVDKLDDEGNVVKENNKVVQEANPSAYPYRWEREILNGLDFVAGDFIETDMDLTKCVYRYVNGRDDLGMDVLFSIGLNDIEWGPWVFYVQFPSVTEAERELPDPPRALYLNPTWLENTSTKNSGYRYCFPDVTKPAHFRLERGGTFWNGDKIDVSRWGSNQTNIQRVIDKLTAANTLYIGSTMGTHSRAKYRFVRVVHNGRDSSIEGGDSNFKEDPGYGGKL